MTQEPLKIAEIQERLGEVLFGDLEAFNIYCSRIPSELDDTHVKYMVYEDTMDPELVFAFHPDARESDIDAYLHLLRGSREEIAEAIKIEVEKRFN